MKYTEDGVKHKTEITESKIKAWKYYLLCIPFLFLISIIFVSVTPAQNDSESRFKPFKINGKDVKEYLMEKYKLHKVRKDDLTSTLQQTPNGPKGKFHIRGNIKPKNVVITEDTVQGRARAVAMAFLREEASLFGVTNMEEIREVKINTINGYKGDVTSVHYRRYINDLELESVNIRITIGPNETISSAAAYLIPPPPELYGSVKKKTLTEDKIYKIIEQDLSPTQKDLTGMKITEIRKIAIASSPYVVWKANAGVKSDHGIWLYKIDAFTGEIINKKYLVIH
jgi:hypothetical protein